MKKYLSIFLTIVMFICFSVSNHAFAADVSTYDSEFTQEEFESFEHVYAIYAQPYSSGLIVRHTLGIAKKDNNLLIIGDTRGNSSVVKCGFTKVVIQRKSSEGTLWSNYKTFNDLYSDSTYYKFSKTVPVEPGYQYRVTAKHYAKKSLFQTEKIDATTNSISF